MVVTADLRTGSVFKVGNDALLVQRILGQKTGRSGMTTRFRVKNIVTGQTQDIACDAGEKFEEVDLDIFQMKLSYIDGDTYVFMEQETFEQYEIAKEDLGDAAGYISPDDDYPIEITFYDGKPVGVTPPILVDRVITYCEPGIKGDTSGKSFKPATLDTGIQVSVPLFCDIGTKIKIDTRDGTFVERAK
jgi:Translation elongation factor P (EF-P)/translation initiation factor 5A (eIF-5A)